MSWKLTSTPDGVVNLGGWAGRSSRSSEQDTVTPVKTLTDGYGGRAHIVVDDHCYLLLLEHSDGKCHATAWWFAAAVDALRQLPVCPDETK